MSNYFTDVIVPHTHYMAARRIAHPLLLEPILREKVGCILQEAKRRGTPLALFETFRSEARQEQLFEAKRTQLRKVGVHHYGLACDLVRIVDGRLDWEADHGVVGELAEAHRLVWGGAWQTIHDPYHVQRIAVGRQGELFAGAFYPGEDYDPLADSALVG